MDNGKIALVTGGSRGLGRDMAVRLAEKGCDLILTYNSNREEGLKTAAEIEALGRKAAVLRLNVGDIRSFPAFFDEVREALRTKFQADHFDYLVNNGGMGGHTPFPAVTEEMFDSLLNVHFKGVYFFTQQALPLLADGGGIVNISSGLARFTMVGASAYASMKGAIEVFTRYLAKELAPRKIRANVVAPGAIATDFNGGRVRDDEQTNKMVSSVTALGRPGVAGDIGGVVAFLCQDDARWITAQRIEVSGGMNI